MISRRSPRGNASAPRRPIESSAGVYPTLFLAPARAVEQRRREAESTLHEFEAVRAEGLAIDRPGLRLDGVEMDTPNVGNLAIRVPVARVGGMRSASLFASRMGSSSSS